MPKGTFGFFSGKYYKVPPCEDYIVIPENADYKSSAISSQIRSNIDECDIDVYSYSTMILSECNAERVAYMKEFLIDERVTSMDKINEDYVINVGYELFNNRNQIIKSGESSIKAMYFKAKVCKEVDSNNSLEYIDGFVFDGRLEISVPEISRYGIKDMYNQHPYTLRLKKISVLTTVGDTRFIKEANSQIDFPNHKHESHCHWRRYMPDHLHFNNYASHFINNARVGTEVIDQAVVPVCLDTVGDYEIVKLCDADLTGNKYTIKINNPLKLIVVNVEMFCDNFNTVYDIKDIDEIIEHNKEEKEDEDDKHHDPYITGRIINIGEDCDTVEEAVAAANAGDLIDGKGMLLTEPLVLDKAINIANFVFDYGASLKITCEGNVEVMDNVFSNNILYGKSGSVRNPLIVNCQGKCRITRNIFRGDKVFYNAIETGQLTSLADGTEICNNRFEGELVNNAISVFMYDEDACIHIHDNIFIAPSNSVRISNYSNVEARFNIHNNNYNDSVASEEYQGFLLLQAVKEEDFSKLTIDIMNLYYKGTKLTENGTGVRRVWYTYNTDTVPKVTIY